MRYISIFVISIFLLFLTNSVSFASDQSTIISIASPTPTVEYGLPYPGLLPDHPLYILKVSRDRILLFFTHDHDKKVYLNLLFADKRLVMGQLLWEKGNEDLSLSTFTKAEKYLLSAALDLVYLKKQNNLPAGLADKVELGVKKHEEIILKLMSTISDDVKIQNLSLALGVNHQAMQQVLLSK